MVGNCAGWWIEGRMKKVERVREVKLADMSEA